MFWNLSKKEDCDSEKAVEKTEIKKGRRRGNPLGDKIRFSDGRFGERNDDVRLVVRRVLEAEQIRRKITSLGYTSENTLLVGIDPIFEFR